MLIRITNISGGTIDQLTNGQVAWVDTDAGSFRNFILDTDKKVDRLNFEANADTPAGNNPITGLSGSTDLAVDIFNIHPSVGGKLVHTNQ